MDVYVLTAPGGLHSAVRRAPDSGGGGLGSSMVEFALVDSSGEPPTLESFQARFPTMESWQEARRSGSVGGMSISSGSMEMLCQMLEQALGRPIVDETGFDGRYDVDLSSGPGDLVQRLRDELGLVLTPDRRPVAWLVVRARPQ